MNDKKKKEELRRFRSGPLTVVQLMIFIAIMGIVVTMVLRHFFSA